MIYEFSYKWGSGCSRIVIFKSIMSIAQSNMSSKKMLAYLNKCSNCKHTSNTLTSELQSPHGTSKNFVKLLLI